MGGIVEEREGRGVVAGGLLAIPSLVDAAWVAGGGDNDLDGNGWVSNDDYAKSFVTRRFSLVVASSVEYNRRDRLFGMGWNFGVNT